MSRGMYGVVLDRIPSRRLVPLSPTKRLCECRALLPAQSHAKRNCQSGRLNTGVSKLLWSERSETLQLCRSSSKDLKQGTTETTTLDVTRIMKGVACVVAGAGIVHLVTSTQVGIAFRNSLMASWLGRSGFVAALSLICLSEIGDKTFFICAILAMRLGRWISFLGTMIALGVMTLFSVGIGVAFNAIPDAMRTSIPIGKYLSVALLFFFGVRSITNGVNHSESTMDGDELADAEETVERAAQSGRVLTDASSTKDTTHPMGLRLRLRSIFVVAALIFVAEWGDRSMLTTIALGASQNPLGVALGGVVGHTLAATIAVVGGSFISKFISERSVNLISGILFIVFAITTALNWT